MMTLGWVAAMAAAPVAVGDRPWRPLGLGGAARSLEAWAAAWVAGLLLWEVTWVICQVLGVPWRRLSLAATALGLVVVSAVVAAWRHRRAQGGSAAWLGSADSAGEPVNSQRASVQDLAPNRRVGWGDAVAAVTVAGFAGAVWTRRLTLPDFVYHWGLKGKRYHLAGGVDFPFLADPLHLTEHPDYPNLLPSLYAATAHVRGFFDERSMLVWSVVFVAALVIFGRTALARRLEGPWLQAGTACFALVVVMFAAGYHLAGGADLLVALGLVLALPALLRGRGQGEGDDSRPSASVAWDDLRVGLAAALVAGAKIEGVPLAGFLVAARLWAGETSGHGWVETLGRRSLWLGRLPRLVALPLAVIVPWVWLSSHYGLWSEANTGAVDPGRGSTVASALLQALATPEWHGLSWLILLLPVLLLVRAWRPAGAVLVAQAALYLYVYLTAQVDPRFHVLSSFPRLVFHLLPALLLLLWLGLGRRAASAVPRARAGASTLAIVAAFALLTGCGGGRERALSDGPVLRYDDLVTDRVTFEAGVAEPRFQTPCADEAPFSRPLSAGGEISEEFDLGQSPTLFLNFCRSEPGALATLQVRVESLTGDGAVEEVDLPVAIAPRWQTREVDLTTLAGRAIRATLSSDLPQGTSLHFRDAYVAHRAEQAAGWPRRGVHVEAEEVQPRASSADPIPPRPAPAPDAPNILLISLDTLRAEVFEATDPEGRPLAPNLVRLAAEGEVFAPHFAGAPWTKPSHATLLTGYPLSVHGADGPDGVLAPSLPTLATRLRAAGYATAGMVHDCVWLNPKFGFHRGFDDYRSVKWETGQIARGAFNWMAAHSRATHQRPFFFFLHTFEAHSDFHRLPYESAGMTVETVAERFGVEGYGCRQEACASGLLSALDQGRIDPLPGEAKILRHLYAAGVAETDANLGRLFDDLRQAGLWEDLLVVVTSDHGEMLLEHGETLHGQPFGQVIRVPLVVKWPRSAGRDGTAGRKVTSPTSSIDVAATLSAVAGARHEDLPGLDLRRPRAERPVFIGAAEWWTVVAEGWKGVLQRDGPDALFHLEEDPAELRDVADRHPDRVARLRALLQDFEAWSEATRERLDAAAVGSEGAAPEVELSADERQRLRALGYLR